MTNRKLKLEIDLIPESSWYSNLRSLMPKEAWDTLRKRVYRDFGFRCGVCGKKGKLSCHELWKFDDKNHIQELTGLIALCELCHSVKHIGLSELRSDRGEIDFETLIKHFMKVNNCSRDVFEEHKAKSVKLFNKRSSYEWKIKIGELENISG